MKVRICDVCYYENHKLELAKRGKRFTSRKDEFTTESFTFDLCDEHRDYFKDCKTLKTAIEKAKQFGLGIKVGGGK